MQGVYARLYAVNYRLQQPGATAPGEDGAADADTAVPLRPA